MDALLLMVVCFGGYILAYHTYGRFLAKKIFKLRGDAPVPSHERRDGIDFVPTRKGIIFGHHFTSIAGTGPIVGPAIGIIWGWLPAILWVTLGCIFMGAVHDFGSLVVSLRNDGKSISEIAARYINKRVRMIFFLIVFLALLIIIAVFGVVIAVVFDRRNKHVSHRRFRRMDSGKKSGLDIFAAIGMDARNRSVDYYSTDLCLGRLNTSGKCAPAAAGLY
jgi:carbon starvation protein